MQNRPFPTTALTLMRPFRVSVSTPSSLSSPTLSQISGEAMDVAPLKPPMDRSLLTTRWHGTIFCRGTHGRGERKRANLQ